MSCLRRYYFILSKWNWGGGGGKLCSKNCAFAVKDIVVLSSATTRNTFVLILAPNPRIRFLIQHQHPPHLLLLKHLHGVRKNATNSRKTSFVPFCQTLIKKLPNYLQICDKTGKIYKCLSSAYFLNLILSYIPSIAAKIVLHKSPI